MHSYTHTHTHTHTQNMVPQKNVVQNVHVVLFELAKKKLHFMTRDWVVNHPFVHKHFDNIIPWARPLAVQGINL